MKAQLTEIAEMPHAIMASRDLRIRENREPGLFTRSDRCNQTSLLLVGGRGTQRGR